MRGRNGWKERNREREEKGKVEGKKEKEITDKKIERKTENELKRWEREKTYKKNKIDS